MHSNYGNYSDFENIIEVLSKNLSIRVIKYYSITNNQKEYSFNYKTAKEDIQEKFKYAFINHMWRKIERLNKRTPLIYTTTAFPNKFQLNSSNINMLEVFDCLPVLSKWEAYIFPFDTTIRIELIDRYENNSYFNCYISDWILNNINSK